MNWIRSIWSKLWGDGKAGAWEAAEIKAKADAISSRILAENDFLTGRPANPYRSPHLACGHCGVVHLRGRMKVAWIVKFQELFYSIRQSIPAPPYFINQDPEHGDLPSPHIEWPTLCPSCYKEFTDPETHEYMPDGLNPRSGEAESGGTECDGEERVQMIEEHVSKCTPSSNIPWSLICSDIPWLISRLRKAEKEMEEIEQQLTHEGGHYET
jgi:hypothetical protein